MKGDGYKRCMKLIGALTEKYNDQYQSPTIRNVLSVTLLKLFTSMAFILTHI